MAILAAAEVAAGQTPATTVSPLTVVPSPPTPISPSTPPVATVEAPSDANALGVWAVVWPSDAYETRLPGHVVLTCDVDRFGLAEWCKVASETPERHGFGAAALELRPTFKVKPAMGPNGPIEAFMNIAVEFKPPDSVERVNWGAARDGGPVAEGDPLHPSPLSTMTLFGGPPLVTRKIAMLNNPVWASTVSHDEVARAYPAKAHGVAGYAVAHCEVERKGSVSGCQLIKEEPANRGFGAAALRLASKFRVAPQWTTAPDHADVWVDIPIRFPAPGEGAIAGHTVSSPYWVSGFDPEQELKVFPPQASAKGISTGYAVVSCVVAEDGALHDCASQGASPAGLGFSEAAVTLASTMRMDPWTRDGSPVDGDVVEFGVRMNLKSRSPAAASARP
ncbi:MAG TPA: energy transducer TonB [Caulobacteraceae bacterium]|nr:energy transducer TonB [Caulobacteraceae bacterium]